MKEKWVKELHFKYEWFVWEQANDYLTKLNMEINKLIAERVDKDTKLLQETIKFLIQDNTKRYALTRVFWILLVICIIIIFTILSSAEYK